MRCKVELQNNTTGKRFIQGKRTDQESTLDLFLDLEAEEVVQTRYRWWDDTSDHKYILYTVQEVNVKVGKCRVSKKMLGNRSNREEAGEWYR